MCHFFIFSECPGNFRPLTHERLYYMGNSMHWRYGSYLQSLCCAGDGGALNGRVDGIVEPGFLRDSGHSMVAETITWLLSGTNKCGIINQAWKWDSEQTQWWFLMFSFIIASKERNCQTSNFLVMERHDILIMLMTSRVITVNICWTWCKPVSLVTNAKFQHRPLCT